jgi:hypothetical protein
MSNYNDTMPIDQQVTMEERIASVVFEVADDRLGDDGATKVSRQILLMVLTEFRPDLLDGFIGVRDEFQFLALRALRTLVRAQIGGQPAAELVHDLTRQIDFLDIH